MAKRFTDTDKYKMPFIRSLQGAYKLLWDFIQHDCNHAGIWIVDMAVAQLYIGEDMHVNRQDALAFFNAGEQRIIEVSGGEKWFIRTFIELQYGQLNPLNRAHASVIFELEKHNICPDTLSPDEDHEFFTQKNKPPISPLQGAMDKDKDKDKDKEKVNISNNTNNARAREKNDFMDMVVQAFKDQYQKARGEPYIITNKGKERSAASSLVNLYRKQYPDADTQEALDGLKEYFARALDVTDPWLHTNMSLTIAYTKINEIKQHIRSGGNAGARKNSSNGAVSESFKRKLLEKMLASRPEKEMP